jgi:predicted metal-binding protein
MLCAKKHNLASPEANCGILSCQESISVMLTLTICVGSSCSIRGSDELAAALEALIERDGVSDQFQIVGAFCMEQCCNGVSLRLDDQQFQGLQPADAESFYYREILPRVRDREAQ